jgi:tetratricopeptide (TPR) repeat protein
LRSYGRYTAALDLAELTLDTLKNSDQKPEVSLAWFHNIAGTAALSLSETNVAELHFLEAEKLSRTPEADELDLLDTLNNIGCFYRETFRPQQALKYQEQALALSVNKFGEYSSQAALRYINLGLVLLELCKLNDAIKLIKKAVEIEKQEPGLSLALCQDMSTLAEVLMDAGKLGEAELYINHAQSIIKSNGYEKHPVSRSVAINMASLFDAKELWWVLKIHFFDFFQTQIRTRLNLC